MPRWMRLKPGKTGEQIEDVWRKTIAKHGHREGVAYRLFDRHRLSTNLG
jgi:hypothetical protein